MLTRLFTLLILASAISAEEQKLPSVVLLGDSIRMNYEGAVKEALEGKAKVRSPKENCRDTFTVLENLDRWLEGQSPQVIHINVGLHDMFLSSKTGKPRHTLETYEKNLRAIFSKLQQQKGARIIFALTTKVNEDLQAKSEGYGRVVRRNSDITRYNETAKQVADEFGIEVNDLYTFFDNTGPEKILRPSDGIHLSPKGCQLVGKEVARIISENLPAGNLQVSRLVPWCIVPFDAKKRNPEQRAEMLVELGLKRCAYDWRPNHVAEFEQEIKAYQKHGIEFFAFWGGHEDAYALFEKYDIHPQVWKTLPSPKKQSQQEKVAAAMAAMQALAKRTADLGCKLGLYNHGGWGGEPANLVAVCKELHKLGHTHVGIVYNWHHGHEHIDDWAASLELMKPWLLCLNLNGMNPNAEPKILALGQGRHEAAMLDTLLKSGYDGPIGILDHQNELDSKAALQDNLNGLQWLLQESSQPGSAGPKPKLTARAPVADPRSVEGPDGLGKALADGIVIDGKEAWRQPPVTVECRVRLDNAYGYNILVASDTKASAAHWEIFSMNKTGELTAYVPGAKPDHIRSAKVITKRKWHEVAMQYAPDRIALWVDGKKVADQKITIQTGRKNVPGDLAFGRLVERKMSFNGAIDAVRIRKGIHPPLSEEGTILGEWDFENLESRVRVDRKPLEPDANPYWQAEVNRERVYDFYAKQAREKPTVLEEFPGLDGGTYGHWGNQNDQTTWKDGRVRAMDHGSIVSGVFKGSGQPVPGGICVAVGENLNAVFDPDHLQFTEAWKGPLAEWSDVRRGFMHGVKKGGEPVELQQVAAPGKSAEYLGLYRDGKEVTFAYRENGKDLYLTARPDKGKVVVVEVDQPNSFAPVWTEKVETTMAAGSGFPYAIDTLTLPFTNPYQSLFFVSGIDFLSASRIAICNIHGDVWICDNNGDKLTWKRFAAGLHQPLGLKVSDGIIHVMGRDQLTALHDTNGDDEADFYQCVSRAQDTSPRGHDFITGLQRDTKGRWYFASGNQGICRISADGKSLTLLATGLRNPNGLGISPDGSVVLSSVQEGTWTPASAVCDVSPGGHFGAGGPLEGERGYVPPMLYLPRGVDNSSGGQTYIDSDRWGPVKDQWLHFSGGVAKYFLVLREEVKGGSQAATVVLPGSFRSGAHRGRFSPYDGQLYVAGAQGWGNYGVDDGCVQRVRYTGEKEPFPYPTAWEARENGILLSFETPPPAGLANKEKWFAQHWNYRYGPAYGSAEYSVVEPERKGHDELEIRSIHPVDGGKKWFIEIPQLQPVNQLHLHFDGEQRIEIFATIHSLGQAWTDFPGYTKIPKTWGASTELVSGNMMDPKYLMSACATCHHPTEQVIGPPFSDIKTRYAGNPDGIVKWAKNPQNKNPQLPPMPSFDFLGDEKLRIIADAILSQ
ncbi:MAG: GDSL-type esterase/lipase family protein [Verrucomicrobiales bacterium]|nr:GDSL-type esterase/lipase family protein [Verrucomicrobiales bacterium]